MDKDKFAQLVARVTPHQKEEELFFLIEFLQKFPIKTVVEIGTGLGGTAAIFKHYFPQVVSIDLNYSKEAEDKAKEYRFDYIVGNSQDEELIKKVVDKLGSIDFLFIDGSHNYEDTKKDFVLWGKLANITGFHDIVWNCGKPGMSTATVWKLWNEIREKCKPDHVKEIICSAYGGLVEHSGIGVIWRTQL